MIKIIEKSIGKKLYQYVLETAKKENVDAIELNVWSFNEDAIKFYESLGMTVKNIKIESLINTPSDTNQININITGKTK